METFRDRTVLVLGASGALGQHIAAAFCQNGAHVVYCARTLSSLEQAARIVQVAPGGQRCIAADVVEHGTIPHLGEQVCAARGRIDAVLDCTSVDMSQEAYTRASTFAPYMRESPLASFVVLGSIASRVSLPGVSRAYAHAQRIRERAIAGEAAIAARYRVRVNGVLPGIIATSRTAPALDAQHSAANLRHRIPLERWGSPAEVADLCMFLTSPAASYLTGECIALDGGLTAVQADCPV